MNALRLALALGLAACGAPIAAAGDGGAQDADAGRTETCESAVDMLIARCETSAMPSRRRSCALHAYRSACATGRSQLVTRLADCLLAADPCVTARAPGSAASCVEGVVSADADAIRTALDHAWCVCSPTELGCPGVPALSGGELAMFDDTDAEGTTACLTAGCGMPTFCFGSSSLGAALLQCDMVTP